MKPKSVDCFMLMNAALTLRNGRKMPEMGRPLIQDVFTTFVNISLTITSLDIVDPRNMDLQVSGIINKRWVDPRLNADEQTRRLAVAGQIWKPKIVIINDQSPSSCSQQLSNDNTMFWRGYDEGNVLLSEKFDATISCTNNLQEFPFDTQNCSIKFGTYRFPMEEVMLNWTNTNPIEIKSPNFRTKEFALKNFTIHTEIEERESGNFTISVLNFLIKRQSNHYFYCLIIPSSLFTSISYLSILLNLSLRYYSRYGLNLTSLAFLLFMYYQSLCSNVPVPYFKAIDKFILLCLGFSILSAVYTFIMDLLRFAQEETEDGKKRWQRNCGKTLRFIEKGIRIAYPIFYLFFAILFGTYYIN